MIAMEATGQYWNALHDELQRRGYSCVVLNPIQTNARSKNQIRKTKTDLVDSGLIARTILSGDARWTIVPDEAMFELRLLVRHRWRLIRTHGIILRYAISLLDRVFPEFEGIFCKPLELSKVHPESDLYTILLPHCVYAIPNPLISKELYRCMSFT